MTHPSDTDQLAAAPSPSLEERAVEARIAGDFTVAATLFADAAARADSIESGLHLALRSAHCLVAAGRTTEAVEIAHDVATRARSEGIPHELADALGLIADHHTQLRQLTQAAQALSEAMYVLAQLPDDPSLYQVVHNLGVSYSESGYFPAALELLERSLRLADNDADRQFSYSSIAAAYHWASLGERDAEVRSRYLHDGLYAATAALEPHGRAELLATAVALAHRSMMLAAIGHYGAALADALEAKRSAGACNLTGEVALACIGEAIARWRGQGDPTVLDVIDTAYALAMNTREEGFLAPLLDVHVEVLWSLGRFDEARRLLQHAMRVAVRHLHAEATARYEHVALGVEHHRVGAISESDPLTGLPNRRYLGHWLPEVLQDNGPVCVGVIDLDGFKQVNDRCTYADGDAVLQDVARMLERVCRRGDAVVRLGGDEFVMVLRDTSPGDARAAFERIRQMIAARRWDGLPSDIHLTASVGVAVGSGSTDAPRVLAAAAEALQMAKRAGRDRIAFR